LSAPAVIAADFPMGMRDSDNHEVSQLNELKCDSGALTFTAHYNLAGNIIMVEQMPIYGGFAGGLEETMICSVATHLNTFVMYGGTWHEDGPIHMRWGHTTARETLACAGWVNRALEEAQPQCLTGNQYYTLAGPSTVMCLLETAAQAICDTASGRELMSGVASAKGVIVDKTTGFEARFMGEASRAVAGKPIEQVNEILDALVSSYEGDYNTAPPGKTYAECYDTVKCVPNEEYLEVYDKAAKALKDLGLSYPLW
jgi:methylamine--corrinoid protein Co-methyltransferase